MAKDKYKIRISNRLDSFLNVDMKTFNFYKPNDKVNKKIDKSVFSKIEISFTI